MIHMASKLIWFSLNESKITRLELVVSKKGYSSPSLNIQTPIVEQTITQTPIADQTISQTSHSRANYESNLHFRANWEREAVGHGYFRGIGCFEILV
ncbi:hypothetical protein DVH24_023386 [Malus domestica]|uniref:Uncharacterized protein n=1 Tax=Malus domestica TaxID=3750 RepID=A0A498KU06_MALDO|nr:hypothetical protein DVH24_023386 [Malus domestica]